MPGLQVLSAPSNQPTLAPKVQSAPVQPTLAPKVATQPRQATLAPRVATQPVQPSFSPVVQSQPANQQASLPVSYGRVIDAIVAAKGRGADSQTILQAIITQNQDKAPVFQEALSRGAAPEQILDKIIQDNYIPSGQEPAPQQGEKGVKGFGLGAVKGVLSTISNLTGLARKVASKVPNTFMTIPGIGPLTQVVKAGGEFDKKLQPYKQNFKPQGTAEKVGFGTEQVAEFFIPAGEVAKATKATEAGIDALKVGKVTKAALKLGARSTIGAGEAAGVTALQGGSKEEVKNAAIFGGVFPIATKAIAKLGSAAKEVSKFIASSLSGVPKDAIEYALKNPQKVQAAITHAVSEGGEMAAQRISQNALDALDQLKEARGLSFKSGLSKLEKEATYTKDGQLYVKRMLTDAEAKATKGYVPGTVIGVPTNLSTKGVKQVATTTLKEFDINAKGRLLDWSEAAIDDTHAHKLQKLVNRIYDWTNTTPTGMNNLRQVIDSYKVGGISLGSSEKKFNAIIGALRTNLSEYVGKRVPQVAEMNSLYAAESEVINNIRSQLKLGSNDPNTALRKLINVFNPKSKVYRPIVEQLGDKAGVDLMADIAGLTMAQWTPEGLGKYITTLVGGAQFGIGFASPASMATIPITAAAASPRIVGKTAVTIGKASQSKAAQVIKKIAPTIGRGAGVQIAR